MSNNEKKHTKYDCWFCHCGRIHIMPYSEYDWLQEDYTKRMIVRVCTNCGATRITYLDEYDDGYSICGSDIYDSFDGRPTVMEDSDEHKYKYYFSKGIRVPLKCGHYADSFISDTYVNTEYLEKVCKTSFIPEAKKVDPNCCIVDTEELINDVKDDDILRSISGYVVGIDWTRTKYERKK